MKFKKCTRCKKEKNVTEFYPRRERGLTEYRPKCKICCSEIQKANNVKNREYCAKSYAKNKEKEKFKSREYRKNNLEKVLETERKSRNKHKEKRLKYSIEYTRNKRKNDKLFYLRHVISNAIYESFRKSCSKKSSKTTDILGCSIEFFLEYIKSQFQKGMTMDNHGKWHLDHIIPVSTAKNEKELIMLNHYTNFQPLWKNENRSKSGKL